MANGSGNSKEPTSGSRSGNGSRDSGGRPSSGSEGGRRGPLYENIRKDGNDGKPTTGSGTKRSKD